MYYFTAKDGVLTPAKVSHEVIVRYPDGLIQQVHLASPVALGARIRSQGIGVGEIVELVCEGCYRHPCICKPDDCPCDPE
jgi:hypothetical protein